MIEQIKTFGNNVLSITIIDGFTETDEKFLQKLYQEKIIKGGKMKNIFKVILFSITLIIFNSCKGQSNSRENGNSSPKIESATKPLEIAMPKDSVQIKLQAKIMEKVNEARAKVISEAVQAAKATQSAIELLGNNKKNDAEKQLQKVISKLNVVKAKYPELKSVPIDINFESNDLITNIKTVKKISKDADDALKKGYLQKARALLSGLSSEIDITTVSIPLGSYPSEIKKALKFINENKLVTAKSILITGLDQLNIEKQIVPIPLLNSEVMLEEAFAEYSKQGKKDKAGIINLLDNSEYQLKLSEALGYGNKDKVYKVFNNDIENLRDSVNSGNVSKGFFNSIKVEIKKFRDSL